MFCGLVIVGAVALRKIYTNFEGHQATGTKQQNSVIMSIKNVAVIGVCQIHSRRRTVLSVSQGSGNLGPAVVQALIDTGFNVTVLTRIDSKATFPSEVNVHKTDYDSVASLAEAFAGQDAGVSTIATAALGQQEKIIDAAVKAGVKRFIPSEFGLNTQKVTGNVAKILGAKLAAQEHLKKVAAENPKFSWTGISTSLFFDWVC